jgi:hypothetical protein
MTYDCLPHQVSDRELTSWIDNSAFDNNGEVEFVEFIEVINMLSRRARAYEREKAVREYGGGGASPNGAEQSRQQVAGAAGREDADADADTDGEGGADDAPSPPPAAAAARAGDLEELEIETVLNESRRSAAPPPRCAAMESTRRKAALLSYYLPTTPFQPMGIVRSAAPPPLLTADARADSAHFQPADADDRPAIQMHRSELADLFPQAAHYATALVIHSFVEPTAAGATGGKAGGKGGEKGGDDSTSDGVPLITLLQLQAWSRLTGFPDLSPLSGPQWLTVLLRWMSVVPGTALVLGPDGAPTLTGVRCAAPAARLPPLAGWDALQLLAWFRCARLLDLPEASPRTLARLPLDQLWPTLGNCVSQTRSLIVANGGRLQPPPAPSAAAAAVALKAALAGGDLAAGDGEAGVPSVARAAAPATAPGARAASRYDQGARVEGSVLLEPPPPPPPSHLVAAKLAGARHRAVINAAPTSRLRARNSHMLRRIDS